MIQTLTQKVLCTAEEEKREINSLKQEVAPIIIKETELDAETTENGGFMSEAYGLVGAESPKIIKALGNSKYSRRTVQSIQKETNVQLEKVIEVLEWFKKNGLGVTTGEPKHYWSLTKKGRGVLGNVIKEKG